MDKYYKYICLLCLTSTLLLGSCGSDDNNASPDYSGERELQLSNIYSQGVVPAHENFEAACQALSSTLTDLSENPTSATLAAAKESWRVAILLWKQCELYDVGEINNSFIHFRIQRWPTDIELLLEALETTEPVTESVIASRGSSTIGLSAIEYLLFHDEEPIILQKLDNTTYRDYISSLGQYLYTQAQTLDSSWANYSDTFKNAVQNGIDGGQNMMGNSLIAYLEETIKLRVGNPFGEGNGGIVVTEDLEAPYAMQSLELISAGFQEWINVYRGEYPGSSSGYGFDDFLVELNYAELDTNIEEAISNCETAIQALAGNSLLDRLTSNPSGVQNLQETMRSLLILIKVDMSSNLDITVVPNDTDGD